jgi:hypothetical protein
MPLWETIVYSVNQSTKEVEIFVGEFIEAPTPRLAQQKCDLLGKGYLVVTGMQVVSEIDWQGKKTDLEQRYLDN